MPTWHSKANYAKKVMSTSSEYVGHFSRSVLRTLRKANSKHKAQTSSLQLLSFLDFCEANKLLYHFLPTLLLP